MPLKYVPFIHNMKTKKHKEIHEFISSVCSL